MTFTFIPPSALFCVYFRGNLHSSIGFIGKFYTERKHSIAESLQRIKNYSACSRFFTIIFRLVTSFPTANPIHSIKKTCLYTKGYRRFLYFFLLINSLSMGHDFFHFPFDMFSFRQCFLHPLNKQTDQDGRYNRSFPHTADCTECKPRSEKRQTD